MSSCHGNSAAMFFMRRKCSTYSQSSKYVLLHAWWWVKLTADCTTALHSTYIQSDWYALLHASSLGASDHCFTISLFYWVGMHGWSIRKSKWQNISKHPNLHHDNDNGWKSTMIMNNDGGPVETLKEKMMHSTRSKKWWRRRWKKKLRRPRGRSFCETFLVSE